MITMHFEFLYENIDKVMEILQSEDFNIVNNDGDKFTVEMKMQDWELPEWKGAFASSYLLFSANVRD